MTTTEPTEYVIGDNWPPAGCGRELPVGTRVETRNDYFLCLQCAAAPNLPFADIPDWRVDRYPDVRRGRTKQPIRCGEHPYGKDRP